MDFTLDSRIEHYRERIRAFVDAHVLPLESDPDAYDEGENIAESHLAPLRLRAREEGLWCFQMPEERGGCGVGVVGMAACYEEMSRSIFGPAVFNCAPPDDGNMILLEKVGTPEQKRRWLEPIVAGEVRSAFVMTEPAPGSGSDPAGMMRTTATRKGEPVPDNLKRPTEPRPGPVADKMARPDTAVRDHPTASTPRATPRRKRRNRGSWIPGSRPVHPLGPSTSCSTRRARSWETRRSPRAAPRS